MFVEELASILAKKSIGKIGKDLFVHSMPQEAKKAIMVTNSTSGIGVDDELRDFYQDVMLVIVRDASIQAAQSRAMEIFNILPVKYQEEGNVNFLYIRPMTLPIVYPRNDAALFEVGMPVEFSAYLLN